MKLKELYGRLGAALIRTYIRVVYRPECVNRPVGDGARIYVSNHTGYLDGLMMLTALDSEKPFALTARDWFDKKLCGPVFTAARCIPINRNGLDTSWLRIAAGRIGEGKSLIVFPEGHTVRTGETGEFKPGFVMLSKLTGAGIAPVWHGEFRAFRKNRLIFGEVSEPYGGAMTAAALSKAGETFRQKVVELGPEAEK